MATRSNIKKLLELVSELETELRRRDRHEQINQALFAIANAINTTSGLDELYQAIHEALGLILDNRNFFIALYDKETDGLSFPFCVDEKDGSLPNVAGVSKTASLSAQIIRTGNALLMTRQEILAYRQNSLGLITPVCSASEVWLGAPLRRETDILGVIAVQSYVDSSAFDETDKEVLIAVADQVALAIDRRLSEEKQERLIKQLHAALEEVKILQGIIPICSNCKNIRDDKGYWNRIESYIQQHSSALFSHSICPDCAEGLYGEEDWYKNMQEQPSSEGGS